MYPENRCPSTRVVTKRYDPKIDRFVIETKDDMGGRNRRVFLTLKSFLEALGADINGADLTQYPYQDEFLQSLSKRGALIGRTDIVRTLSVPECKISDPLCLVYYITDVHLDEKIDRMLSEDPNCTLETCIHNIVCDVCESTLAFLCDVRRPVILIGGDVSHDAHVVEMFYKELKDRRLHVPVIGILGNHELWDKNTWISGKTRVSSATEYYSSRMREHGAFLLERSLIVYHQAKEFRIMDEKRILEATAEEISAFTLDSMITIFGGLGYSALNPKYNATSGMYKGAVDPDEEKNLSERMARLYHKIREAIPDRTVVVFTHTPLHDWTDEDYQPGWIYVHGHDHHNRRNMDDGYREYADGQVGYEGTPQFKIFDLEWMRDIFIDLPDGIHTITADEYRAFYFLKGMKMQSKMTDDVIMLKRGGFYCFLVDDIRHGLRFLDGGMKRKANHDVHYYYDNMTRYAELACRVLSEYNERLETIASEVKAFGGRGRIHGCIVDIDFFNHLYVNPLDGQVTPYFARDIIDKTVYPSVTGLLQERCPGMYPRYLSLTDGGNCSQLMKTGSGDGPIKYYGTEIYRVSKKIYKFQRMEEYMVIRVWDDSILDFSDSDEIYQNIMSMLIGPTI